MWTQKSQFYILRKPKYDFWVYIRIVRKKVWIARYKLQKVQIVREKVTIDLFILLYFLFYVAETWFHIIQYKCKYRVAIFGCSVLSDISTIKMCLFWVIIILIKTPYTGSLPVHSSYQKLKLPCIMFGYHWCPTIGHAYNNCSCQFEPSRHPCQTGKQAKLSLMCQQSFLQTLLSPNCSCFVPGFVKTCS